jgi:tetratricopeptide (TPR) repeat protein
MLMARGMTAEGHADWELARKYYLEAADKWPTDAALWKSLGRIQFRLDQFEKAAEAFHKSLELSSSDSNTYWWLAATLLLSNQKEEYQKLIERMDRLGHVGTSWAELARTTNLGKNSPEAAQRALMLAEKGTADRSAPDWQFRLLATSRIRAGQLDEGVKYHLDAVKRLPNSRANMLHWLPLAIAAHQRGDRSETQKWFDLSKEQMAQLRKEFSPELSTPLNVHINDWIEAQVLYREVSELLENQKK